MVSHSDEGNRFANVPKDWADELSSQHRSIAIGLLVWFARNVVDSEAQRAIILTLLIYFVIGIVITVLAAITGVSNALGWPLALIFLLFAIAYAYFLFIKPNNT